MRIGHRSRLVARSLCGVLALAAWTATGAAQTPQSVSDIAAVLEHEKPDPTRVEKLEERLRRPPPAGSGARELSAYYLDRGDAYHGLGRSTDAIAAHERAIEAGGLSGFDLFYARGVLATNYRTVGNLARSLALNETRVQEASNPQGARRLPNTYRTLMVDQLALGDLEAAEATQKRLDRSVRDVTGGNTPPVIKTNYRAIEADTQGRLFEARGLYRRAEQAYVKASQLYQEVLDNLRGWPGNRPSPDPFVQARDLALANAGVNQARQGRFTEAEISVRRALMNEIQSFGRYGAATTPIVGQLANVVMQQGRYRDAERLARIMVETYADLGYPAEVPPVVRAKALVMKTLALQEHWDAAAAELADVERSMTGWDASLAAPVLQSIERITVLLRSGRIDDGIAAARATLDRKAAILGNDHVETALARGTLAVGYAAGQRGAEAMPLFAQAVPVLTSNAGKSDDASGGIAASDQQIRLIVETYIALLATARDAPPGIDPALESLRLVDFIRGQSVQRALAASNARAAARDPELAEIVRREQDTKRQLSGMYQAINDALSLPPQERNGKAIQDLQAKARALAAARDNDWRAIERKFPQYANLIDPKPPGVDEIRAALKPDEAFVSFYLGTRSSFVWAVPKTGPVAFAAAPVGANEVETKVAALREALEPKASTIEEIPPFDVAAAHEIYRMFLQPTEAAWKPARHLIFVTNGALGLLPLGLLPTAPVTVDTAAQPKFAGYRAVPWLARTHAVTLVPSAAAFTSLRGLPRPRHERAPMIGFGDPLFSREQARDATQVADASGAATATRGVPLKRRNAPQTQGVDKAELALLPRLPDTADELRSIALALQADPSKVVHLGKSANTRMVKSSDLAGYKVIAFATHGLVPGELEGLHQPALALSAPDVADVDGDGLLTMDEILGLRLDADWVVLSACNTGAGAGAGAEAASGLGRAFFYAGTRAILVTNWSVHSDSARELVTDLFRRQAAYPALSRGEALRQAMMALLDGPGLRSGGQTLFAYGHPLFWAPYSLIGDGGGT
ncbi:MAG: CHAT domain-containing protein [Gemmatimonas sp.]